MKQNKKPGRPKTRGETVPLNLRISKELSERIENYSSFSGYNKTQICESLIKKGIDQLIEKQIDEFSKWEKDKSSRNDIFDNFKFKL